MLEKEHLEYEYLQEIRFRTGRCLVYTSTFLCGYSEDAYGKEVTVRLLHYRRPEQKFDSIEEMKACIEEDILYGKHFFGMEK